MTSFAEVWEILGIPVTADAAAVRRAYSRKLKVTQPEDDPAGFQRLRAAYERAQFYCEHHEMFGDLGGLQFPAQADATDPAATTDVDTNAEFASDAAAESAATSVDVAAPRQAAPPTPAPIQDPESTALDTALHALESSLRDAPDYSAANAERHLRDILSSPSLERLDLLQAVERRLAELLMAATPRSDPLLAATITRFGWDNELGDGFRPPLANAVIHRRDVARLQDHLENGTSEDSRAYQRLAAPPRPLARLWRAYAEYDANKPEVALLRRLEDEHPALLDNLHPDNVSWWRRYPERLQFSLTSVLIGLIVGLVMGAVYHAAAAKGGSTTSAPAHIGIVCAGLAALGLFRIFALDWPAMVAARRWNFRPPLAFSVGWLPASAVALLLADLARGVPALAWLVASVALAIAWWGLIADGPTRPVMGVGEFKPKNSRLVRIVLGNVVVGVWLTLTLADGGLPIEPPLAVTIGAALVASASARPSLLVTVANYLLESRRRDALIALAVASGAMIFALVGYGDDETARPWLLVGVLALVVLRRALVFVPPSTARLNFSPIGLGVLGIMIARGIGAAFEGMRWGIGTLDWLVIGGSMMLVGVIATVISAFRELPR